MQLKAKHTTYPTQWIVGARIGMNSQRRCTIIGVKQYDGVVEHAALLQASIDPPNARVNPRYHGCWVESKSTTETVKRVEKHERNGLKTCLHSGCRPAPYDPDRDSRSPGAVAVQTN